MDNASECGYGQKVIGLVGLKEIKIGLLLTVKAHFLNTLFGRCNECVMKEKSNQETQKGQGHRYRREELLKAIRK